MSKEKNTVKKNYSFCGLSKKDLKKDKIKEISDDNKSIKKLYDEVAEKNVEIYAFKLKKSIKAIYIFEKIKEDKETVYKIDKVFFTKDVTEEEKENMKEVLLDELKELIGTSVNIRVDIGDIEIVPQTILIGGKYNVPLSAILLVFSLVALFVLDDWFIFSIILIISATSGAIVRKK